MGVSRANAEGPKESGQIMPMHCRGHGKEAERWAVPVPQALAHPHHPSALTRGVLQHVVAHRRKPQRGLSS